MSNLTEEFLKWLPKHPGGLRLDHNPHHPNTTPDVWIEDNLDTVWKSESEKMSAIDNDEIWFMGWIFGPDFRKQHHKIAAPTLEKLLLFAHDAQFREGQS